MNIKHGLGSMVYKFIDNRTSGGGAVKIAPNKELAKELHKPSIKQFEKRKVHSSFIDNTWGASLADM